LHCDVGLTNFIEDDEMLKGKRKAMHVETCMASVVFNKSIY
jgi:hypothetical protein